MVRVKMVIDIREGIMSMSVLTTIEVQECVEVHTKSDALK